MTIANQIGHNVRDIRKGLKQNQEVFAEHIDCSRDTISNIERGKVIASTKILLAISKYTGYTVDDLIHNPRT